MSLFSQVAIVFFILGLGVALMILGILEYILRENNSISKINRRKNNQNERI